MVGLNDEICVGVIINGVLVSRVVSENRGHFATTHVRPATMTPYMATPFLLVRVEPITGADAT